MASSLQRYAIKRLLHLFPVLFGVSIITFLFIHIAPGGPAYAMLGVEATPEKVAQIRAQYGLDQPLPVQYVTWLANVVQLELGESIIEGVPVSELIVTRLPVSLSVAIAAMTVSLAISIPAGIVSAVEKDEWPDTLARVFAFWGVSMPNFWLGILLILFVSVRLGWLPIYGYVSPTESVVQWIRHLILPAITLGTALAAIVTRIMRSSMLETLNEDYLKTARAKGVDERTIVTKHALRNALIPVTTIVGLQLGSLLGGSVLVEVVFALPGMGQLVVDSIFSRDFPVVQGAVLVYALIFVLVNLGVDLLYAYIDPRIKY
ncbi:nickel ABC transporter permease [Halorussus halobius]|uniref:nickel ABC transporter permease n=1 Tax=Halorussus halobius TaxID=1710537 RepID=UPI001B2FF135|nr:nickel ABC transporter permease [Halorussus halobius]